MRGLCGPRFYLVGRRWKMVMDGFGSVNLGGMIGNLSEKIIMKNNGMKIKHPKLRGEWAEMRFMARAAEEGLCVTKPFGEMARYDFAVEYKGSFARVQVKSTMFVDRGGYSCSVRGWSGPYEGDPFDFLAVYVIPEDVWYIIPAVKFHMQGSIALYPRLKKSKYGSYKEAWQLLRPVVDRIEACAEGFVSECPFTTEMQSHREQWEEPSLGKDVWVGDIGPAPS